jgi:hypothetical protein
LATTDDKRQTDIFELTLIHMGFVYFCMWEGNYEWGEIYILYRKKYLQVSTFRKTVYSNLNQNRVSTDHINLMWLFFQILYLKKWDQSLKLKV